jgi:hypothetical protein
MEGAGTAQASACNICGRDAAWFIPTAGDIDVTCQDSQKELLPQLQ